MKLINAAVLKTKASIKGYLQRGSIPTSTDYKFMKVKNTFGPDNNINSFT